MHETCNAWIQNGACINLRVVYYSQAVKFNNVVYLSGVLGVDVKTNKLVTGGAAVEAKMVLTNMANILAAAGSGFDKVIKSTVMLNDINDFAAVNEVYKQCNPSYS